MANYHCLCHHHSHHHHCHHHVCCGRKEAQTYLVQRIKRFLNYTTLSHSVFLFFSNLTAFIMSCDTLNALGNYWDTLHKIIVVLYSWVVQIKGSFKGPYQAKCCLLSMCTTRDSYCKTQKPQCLIIFFHVRNYFLDWFDPTSEVHWGFQCLSRFTKWLLLCSLFSKCVTYRSSKSWKGMCSLSISLLVVLEVKEPKMPELQEKKMSRLLPNAYQTITWVRNQQWYLGGVSTVASVILPDIEISLWGGMLV